MIDPAVVPVDEPLGSDQYRHITTRAWWMANFGSASQRYAYLAEVVEQVWVPANQRRDWLLDRRTTGRREWLLGAEAQAAENGFEMIDPWPAGRWRAPYGDFSAVDTGLQPSPREGYWQVPTPDFLADLPRDPRQLNGRLRADSPRNRPGYNGAFVYATDALRTGRVPADLRAALYRALLLLPDTQITKLDGTSGKRDLSLSLDDGIHHTEIFIDRVSGQFAGERDTLLYDENGLKAGTVTKFSAVSVEIVDGIG